MNNEKTVKNTKDRIFESAVYLFTKRGYQGTSMRDLAKEVGIKESTIYYHFDSKNAILEAILEYYIDGFRASTPTPEIMKEIVTQYTDPVEFWLGGVAEFFKRQPPLMSSIASIFLNEMFIDKDCRRFVLESMFLIQKKTTEMLLKEILAKGMIRQCDISKTAEQYVYMLHGLDTENRLLMMEGSSFEEIQKKLIEHIAFFIEGLK